MTHRLPPAILAGIGTFCLGLSVAATAAAPDWTVQDARSSVTFTGTHAGEDFSGVFGNWDARIRFDPDQLDSSRIIVVIDTGSARTGDSVQESTLKNGEWFDVANHPTATFASNDIRARGNGYVARGTLTIKGKATPVTLPFTLSIDGRSAMARGSLTLDRLALDLGAQSDPKAQWVSQEIGLSFSVSATR